MPDPSFLALVAIDSRIESLLTSVAVFTSWVLVSHIPLSLVMLALPAGRDSAPVRRAIVLAQHLAAPTAVILLLLLVVAWMP